MAPNTSYNLAIPFVLGYIFPRELNPSDCSLNLLYDSHLGFSFIKWDFLHLSFVLDSLFSGSTSSSLLVYFLISIEYIFQELPQKGAWEVSFVTLHVHNVSIYPQTWSSIVLGIDFYIGNYCFSEFQNSEFSSFLSCCSEVWCHLFPNPCSVFLSTKEAFRIFYSVLGMGSGALFHS